MWKIIIETINILTFLLFIVNIITHVSYTFKSTDDIKRIAYALLINII